MTSSRDSQLHGPNAGKQPTSKLKLWKFGPPGFVPEANGQLNELDRRTSPTPGAGTPGQRIPTVKPTLAKITGDGDSDGQYKATEIKGVDNSSPPPTAVDFNDSTNARTWNGGSGSLPQVVELSGRTGIATGTLVELIPTLDQDGKRLWVFSLPGSSSFVFAQLSETSTTGIYSAQEYSPSGKTLSNPKVFDGQSNPKLQELNSTGGYPSGFCVIAYPEGDGWYFFGGLPGTPSEYKSVQGNENQEIVWDYPRAHL